MEIENKEQTHKEISAKGGRAKSEAKTASSRRNATAKRFSKQRFIDYLSGMYQRREDEWGFDEHNGYAQVRGEGVGVNASYGKWTCVGELIEVIDYGEIKPFSKKAVLEYINRWIGVTGEEEKKGDLESRARSEGAAEMLVKIVTDINDKAI